MQILNQSQTALNLPNFTQCLKKFVFPCKKGVKTAQVASQRELGRGKEGGGRGKGQIWSARQKDGKSCRDIDGLRLRLHNERVKEWKRWRGERELFVWQVKFGAKDLALVLARGFMNERSVAQIFDKSRECALTYAVVTSRFAPVRTRFG